MFRPFLLSVLLLLSSFLFSQNSLPANAQNGYPYINFCPGATVATISAPLGYATYQWFAPGPVAISPANGGNTPTVTITNPVPGTVYTVQLVAIGSVTFMAVDTLQYTSVAVDAIGSNSSCIGGASGSATVLAWGSATGYNYAWYGPSGGGVIATTPTIANIAPGVYTVGINAIGAAACGSAVSTVTVGQAASTYTFIKTFCGNTAYLSTPASATNIQWYNDYTPIPVNQGGAATGYTATPVSNGSVFRVRYQTPQGCQDSVTLLLSSVANGSISIVTPTACSSINNGTGVFTITTAGFGLPPTSLSVYSLPSGISFSTITSPSLTTFTINNLTGGASYSVSAFDGSCQYSNTFSVSSYSYNFNAVGPPAICPGGTGLISVSFTTPIMPAQYGFTWSPITNMATSNVNNSVLLMPPTPAFNTSVTTIYTVLASPTVINCPMTKTLAVTAINFPPPTISAVPIFCNNAAAYTITASPPGGSFVATGANPAVNAQGILTPSLANAGVNTFSYSMIPGSCADVGSTYTIHPVPPLTVSGNTVICQGQSTTLTALGATTYTWNNSPPGSQAIFSPSTNSVYGLAGSFTTGCTSTQTVAITVNNNPTVSVFGNSPICTGDSVTLTLSGANLYFLGGGAIGNQITFNPPVTTTYSISGIYSSNGCTSTLPVMINVNPLPVIAVAGNTLICSGQSSTLNVSGASVYYWTNGGSAATQVILTPAVTSNYLVTGTNTATGCVATQTIIVTVNPTPTLSLSGNTVICQGLSGTLTASGSFYYYWNNSTTPTIPTYVISPLNSTTYTLTGTGTNGCSAVKTIYVYVAPCTGVEEQTANNMQVKLYPNPGSGIVTLELEDPARVFVFDELGRLVFEKRFVETKNSMDLSALPPGIYLVKTWNEKEQGSLKFIRQRD